MVVPSLEEDSKTGLWGGGNGRWQHRESRRAMGQHVASDLSAQVPGFVLGYANVSQLGPSAGSSWKLELSSHAYFPWVF